MNARIGVVAIGIIISQLPTHSGAASQQREPFVETIAGTLVKFTMVPVPDGSITLGGEEHTVRNLWMSESEITWDAYDVWAFQFDLSPKEQAEGVDAESRPTRPYGAPDRGFGHQGYPAISMTHHAAVEFCKWLSKKTGRKYRLPTEAEWEYAARAKEREYDLRAVSWHWDNAEDKTHPVGKKAPNQWGLHDTLGNAAEWCDGLDGKPVLCGGSFADKAEKINPGARAYQTPDWNERDPQIPKSTWWLSDAPFAGFRVVCEGGL
ncbi:MAG: SUMF1/EgtB/PvdO family nonheme iron enzyme [Armatimonadetes bacterium]|nr:SUMF1/EgtB/PvdO family nonheme iron enzyme [Armatimonadota bacterium]